MNQTLLGLISVTELRQPKKDKEENSDIVSSRLVRMAFLKPCGADSKKHTHC